MKETQIHAAFSKWLDKEGICYVHSRTDKRSHTKKGDPDYCCALTGRCLFVELKILGGKLSKDQEKRIAQLRAAGNKVVIAFSLQEAVAAVRTWAGIETENDYREAVEREIATLTTVPTPRSPHWICAIYGKDYVMTGESSAGGIATKVRNASPQDLRDLPRR